MLCPNCGGIICAEHVCTGNGDMVAEQLRSVVQKHDDLNTALTRMQIRAEQAEKERDTLRSILAACHVSLGEDPASDDETLPEGILLHLEGHAEIARRLEQAEKERDEANSKLTAITDAAEDLCEALKSMDERSGISGWTRDARDRLREAIRG